MTSTFSTSTTFSKTHAKQLAAKVVADLYQCSMLYDRPDADDIEDYKNELIEMLVNEYVYSYEFGFKLNGKRVLSWFYTVGSDGGLHGGDSASGGIYAKAEVAHADYFNFMTYSNKWADLTNAKKATFRNSLPIQRTAGSSPTDGNGYWEIDRAYSAGGIRIERKTFRPQ